MLDLAGVRRATIVIDLGSGDGRTVIAAAKRGAHALGIEYNPEMVELSRENAAEAAVGERAVFCKADLFETDFSQATVITMFLLPSINMKLRPTLLGLRPARGSSPTRFSMEDWQADETATVGEKCTSWCTALLWIVPAKVAGRWRMPQGDLTLEQQFQVLTGSFAGSDGRRRRLPTGGCAATRSRSRWGTRYVGRVTGSAMEGTGGANGKTSPWRATRVG